MTETISKNTKTDQNGGGAKGALTGIASQLPIDRLKSEAQDLGQALVKQGFSRASGGVESLTGKLNDYAQGNVGGAAKMAKNVAEGDSPAKAGVKAAASKVKDKVKEKLGGGGGGGHKIKVTNILESVDVPVSREVAYQQWTLFEDFPTFMKKVENVKQEEDEKLTWKAQVFWSHRSWDAEIVEQVPNERIVWKSDGEKGHVDGAVTFHELAPDLTRVQVILEYHPKGLFEHTGNLWRAQGRRARLELKHFARHVSTRTILHQEEVEGWPGEIKDGEVIDREGDSEDEAEEQDTGRKAAQDKSSEDKSSEDKSSENKSSENKASEEGRKASTRGRRKKQEEDGDQAQADDQADDQGKAQEKPRKKSSSSRTTRTTKTTASKRPRRATKASAG